MPFRTRKEFADARAAMSRRTVAELLDLLGAEDLATRFLAEMCLRAAAGT
ncbi:MAG TPA: hypothetical protein VN228_19325 [Pyrinomonadaceae bacterium]|nr:hypothetical protein [Pyrinomonadaceae bacterium]